MPQSAATTLSGSGTRKVAIGTSSSLGLSRKIPAKSSSSAQDTTLSSSLPSGADTIGQNRPASSNSTSGSTSKALSNLTAPTQSSLSRRAVNVSTNAVLSANPTLRPTIASSGTGTLYKAVRQRPRTLTTPGRNISTAPARTISSPNSTLSESRSKNQALKEEKAATGITESSPTVAVNPPIIHRAHNESARVSSAPAERQRRISFAPEVDKKPKVPPASAAHLLSSSATISSGADSDKNDIDIQLVLCFAQKEELERTVNQQTEQIMDLEHKCREAERKEAIAVKEKNSVIKELEQLKKFMVTDNRNVEELKAQLQEEHTVNASLIIFNRSLKTQLYEMEAIIENLVQNGGPAAAAAQAALAKLEMEREKQPSAKAR
ncbi:hypothetical protein HDV05_004771 [Chytridiales sp. JEL 0842]|nr:hypothetical protein HDV05_004771 [Chytridiales sp. JEL 0842]